MQVDFNTFLGIIACVISVGTILWKTSADAAARKAFETYTASRDKDRDEYRKQFEASVEARFSAVTATNTLLRENVAELRERLVGNYMTKAEISAIETRVTDNQGRILDHLEALSGRLNTLSDKIAAVLARGPQS